MHRRTAAVVIGAGIAILGAALAPQGSPAPPVLPVKEDSAAACHAHNGLPDTGCTPGATDPRVTQENIGQTICRPGYTATVRPPVSVTEPIKRMVMQRYGYEGLPAASVELDHLIPLELGGCPDCQTNLWPELWNPADGTLGAHAKDALENALKREVCSGSLRLVDAQQIIHTDWVTAYHRYVTHP